MVGDGDEFLSSKGEREEMRDKGNRGYFCPFALDIALERKSSSGNIISLIIIYIIR